MSRLTNWMYKSKAPAQQAAESDDDLDEFFDCMEEEDF